MEPCGPTTCGDLFKLVRSILDKLTPEKFKQLMKQVMDLTINKEEQVEGVMDLDLEKAIDEPSFSVTYENMCRCLAELKVPTTEEPNDTVSFIKLLLSRCKKEFDNDKEELQEAEGMIRLRSVGKVKFIGELYKLKLLTTANIQACMDKLLDNHTEESLECLCSLFTTIGRDTDSVVAKPEMDKYFNKMITIVKEGQTSSRIRLLLQDIINLRLPQMEEKNQLGPRAQVTLVKGSSGGAKASDSVKPEPVLQSPQEQKLISALPRELRHHMERILLEDIASEQQVFSCVKEKRNNAQKSSSPYLREMMAAVCKAAGKGHTNCRVHTALFHKRLPAVVKYRNTERERQQEALKELQALIVTLDHPPHLLRILYKCLAGTRQAPDHLPDEGVALKTVTDFFTWLWEAELVDN